MVRLEWWLVVDLVACLVVMLETWSVVVMVDLWGFVKDNLMAVVMVVERVDL